MKRRITCLLLSLALLLSLLPATVLAATGTVTYDLAGGTQSTGVTFQTAPDSDGTVTLPAQNTLTKTGYTLVGWTDGTNGYLPGAKYTVSGNPTLTALWTAKNPDTLSNVAIAGKVLSSGQYYHNGTAGAAGTVNSTAADASAMYVDGVLVLSGLNVNCAVKGIKWEYNDLIVVLLPGSTNKVINSDDTAIGGELGGSSYTPDLIVRGAGKLDVTGKTYGIWAWKDITFEDGAQVTVTAQTNSGVLNNTSSGTIAVKSGASLTASGKEYGVGTDHTSKGSLIVESGASFTAKGESGALRNIENTKANFNSQTIYVSSSSTAGTNLSAWNTTAALTGYKYISTTGAVHEHSWGYTLSADKTTITATCTASGCSTPAASGRFWLTAPDNLIYDGDYKQVFLYADGFDFNNSFTLFLEIVYKIGNTTWDFNNPPTNAGTYTASLTYQGLTAEVSLTIAPRPVTVDSTNITLSGDMTYKPDGVTPTVTVKDDKGNVIPASEYTVTYTNNTAVGTATVTITDNVGGNYTVNGSTTFEITKATANLTVNPVNVTYDGAALEIGEGKDVPYSANTAGTLSWKDGNAPMYVSDSSSDSKEWWVVFTPTDTTNYKPSERKVSVTIAPKPVTITAGPKSAYVGAAMPTLTYQTTGLLGTDTLTTAPTLTCNANMNAEGTYPITVSDASAGDNYAITYVPGTLTVSNKLVPTLTLTPDNASLIGGGTVALTVSGIPEGAGCTVTCDTEGVTLTGSGSTWSATLPNTTPNYTFTAASTETGSHAAASASCTVAVTQYTAPTVSAAYPVVLEKTKNGSISVSRKSASEDDAVTITVTPDRGYTLETLTVLDKNGKALKLTAKGAGKYTFWMPASGVTVTATFAEDNSMLNFFVDVPADAYFYDAVLWAAENGITSGVDENRFAPDWSCTRAQLVTFLWRAAGKPASRRESSMSDVTKGAYYAKAVAWAAENGIIKGYSDGRFGGEDLVTREQMAAILYRFAQNADDAQSGRKIQDFSDYADISAYAVPAVQWAADMGIMQGYHNRLMPQAACTRAQIVTMLYRLLHK